jgi:hypothetical protein
MSVKTALVKVGDDVEVEAGKLLHDLASAEAATPKVAAAIGVLFAATDKATADAQGAAASEGLNITLDKQTASDLVAVWNDAKSDVAKLGVKL